jgi:hypothetical protein
VGGIVVVAVHNGSAEMGCICFTYLLADRIFEGYEAGVLDFWKSPRPTIVVLLDEEPPESAD